MGGEGLIGVVAGMLCGVAIGLLTSIAMKVFAGRPKLPGWPMLAFSIIGGMVPALMQHWRYA